MTIKEAINILNQLADATKNKPIVDTIPGELRALELAIGVIKSADRMINHEMQG